VCVCCMCVCVCACVCVTLVRSHYCSQYVVLETSLCVDVNLREYVYVCMIVCVCVCVYMRVCVCECVYVCVYVLPTCNIGRCGTSKWIIIRERETFIPKYVCVCVCVCA
jgi:hypothetical protein